MNYKYFRFVYQTDKTFSGHRGERKDLEKILSEFFGVHEMFELLIRSQDATSITLKGDGWSSELQIITDLDQPL